MKKILSIPLIILGSLLGLILVLSGILFASASLNREESSDFFSPDHTLRIEVDSVSGLIGTLTEWEGASIFLEEPEMAGAYESFIEWKNNPLRESRLIKALLALKADILFDDQFKPLILIDLGWRSSPVRAVLKWESLRHGSPLAVESRYRGDAAYRQITLPPEDGDTEGAQQLYLGIRGNILILSPSEPFLAGTLQSAPFPVRDSLNYSFDRRPDLKIHLNTDRLLEKFSLDFPGLDLLSGQLPFHEETLLAAYLEEDQLTLEGYVPVSSDSPVMTDFLSADPGELRVPRKLPLSVNILSGYRYGDFSSFLSWLNLFLPEEKQFNPEDYRGITKTLLGLMPEDITGWIGEEAGAFSLEGYSSSPVYFVEIRDQKALSLLFEALKKSLFIKAQDNLLMDDTRITRLSLPGPLKLLTERFTGPLETPFIINREGYLFLSHDPETLAYLSRELGGRDTLASTDSFKKASGQLPEKSPLLFYYDLNSAMPRVLLQDNPLSKLIRLYEKGHFYVTYHRDEIRFQFHGVKTPPRQSGPFPGFPLDTGENIMTPVLTGDLGESRLPEFAFLNKEGELIITNFLGTPQSRTLMPEGTSLLEMTRGEGVLTFGRNGFLTVPLEGLGLSREETPFPWSWTFDPVPFGRKYLLFRRDEGQLYLISPAETEPFGPPFSKTVLNEPDSLKGKFVALYPKDLFGTLYVLNSQGSPLPGWPRQGGAISLSGPRFLEDDGEDYLLYLSQKGTLDIRGMDGQPAVSPIDMGESYLSPPVAMKDGRKGLIALLSEKGRISLLDGKGNILREEKLRLPRSEEVCLLAYDIEGDGRDELFLHSAGNRIFGWDSTLTPLSGFPLDGHYRPVFTDLDGDGTPEMISGGVDKKIYAYSLRNLKKDE